MNSLRLVFLKGIQMSRRTIPCISLFALMACQGENTTGVQTPDPSDPPPVFLIADGAHGAGNNPDFFFLPPVAPNPSESPNWDADGFDPSRQPSVSICEVNATTEGQVNSGASCKAGEVTYVFGDNGPAAVQLRDDHYQVNWMVPKSGNVFYRIKVKVGSIQLGAADVKTAANEARLKNVNTGDFVPLIDGRILPINFRIESGALLRPANDQLAVGNLHACVIQANRETACWGSRSFAQLGDGMPPSATVAARVTVAGNHALSKVVSHGSHTCGTTVTDTILCWGRNQWSQVTADGTQSLGVVVPTPMGGGPYKMVSPTRLTSCGLSTSNAAVCWGLNPQGQVGDGTTIQRLTPVPVSTTLQFSSIEASWLHTCALTAVGAAHCWGAFLGQLNLALRELTPVPVGGGHVFTRLHSGGTHTCGLTATHETWCWGDNASGQLGDGTTTSGGPPVLVSGGLAFSVVATGTRPNSGGRSHTCAITLTATAYCWGLNEFGQLGDGTTTDRLVPTPVLTNEVFVAIGAGDNFTCAMTPDQRVFCWGSNANGELGTGTAGGMSSAPVLVP